MRQSGAVVGVMAGAAECGAAEAATKGPELPLPGGEELDSVDQFGVPSQLNEVRARRGPPPGRYNPAIPTLTQ
jgi:hypothetical protein